VGGVVACLHRLGAGGEPGPRPPTPGGGPPRPPANAAANIENPAFLRKCNPLSLLASGGQASRMEMLDSRKDFRGQNLWVLSQFSQCGVDPRKHPRSRPMRLNIRRPFSHGVLSRSIQRNYAHLAIYINSRQAANHDRGRFMRWPRHPHRISVEGQLLSCQELLTSFL